jgi:hypothetical protein
MRTGAASKALVLVLAILLAGCAKTPESEEAKVPQTDFTELELAATATTGIIRGIVVDDAIRPIGGARLVLQAADGPRETVSKEDGAFGFDDLEGGPYFIQASKPGYTSVQTAAEVVPGVEEPPITKVLLVADPATTPFVQSIVWNGFIECSTRVGVPGTTGVGLNGCNGVGNQNVNFPIDIADMPTLIQGETIWKSTQTLGSGLSFVVGPKSCEDVKWARADGPSTLVILLNQTDLEDEDAFVEDEGLCYRVFSWTADEIANAAGLVLSQRFDSYFHLFYNFLPPEGWKFSVDGEPVPPS